MIFLTPIQSTASVRRNWNDTFPAPVASTAEYQDVPFSEEGAAFFAAASGSDSVLVYYRTPGSSTHSFLTTKGAIAAATAAAPLEQDIPPTDDGDCGVSLYTEDGTVKWRVECLDGSTTSHTTGFLVGVQMNQTYTGGVLTNEAESGSLIEVLPQESFHIPADAEYDRVVWIQAAAGLAFGGEYKTWDGATTVVDAVAPNPSGAYFAKVPKGNLSVRLTNPSQVSTLIVRRIVAARIIHEMTIDPMTKGGLWRRERKTDMLDGRVFLDRSALPRLWYEIVLKNHPDDADAQALEDIAELVAVLVLPSGGYIGDGSSYARPNVLRLVRAVKFQGFTGWKATHTLGATGSIRFDEVSPPRSLDFLQQPDGDTLDLPSGDPLGLPFGN